ncbi:hypothetical protein [Pacificibacter sp. AS14]|uniref:hypothetical protein n=1 Tax=Pacificibacter sp. AS14 TaxID=3135785 RepID=UPI00316C42F5
MTNTARILEEVVSLEAWHSPLVVNVDSPFHVALSFSEGRFQGGKDNNISFKVALKRATLVVFVDDNLKVPNKTKVREYPTRNIEVSRTNRESEAFGETNGSKTSGGGEIGLTKLNAKATQEENSGTQQTSNMSGEHKEFERVTRAMRMTHHKVGTQETWKIEPIDANTLQGMCHDGDDALIKITPKTALRLSDMAIRVFLKCDAEDIEVSDIELDKSLLEKLSGANLQRRKKQAKIVIAQKLAERSLELVDLDKKYQEVILADVLAVPE